MQNRSSVQRNYKNLNLERPLPRPDHLLRESLLTQLFQSNDYSSTQKVFSMKPNQYKLSVNLFDKLKVDTFWVLGG